MEYFFYFSNKIHNNAHLLNEIKWTVTLLYLCKHIKKVVNPFLSMVVVVTVALFLEKAFCSSFCLYKLCNGCQYCRRTWQYQCDATDGRQNKVLNLAKTSVVKFNCREVSRFAQGVLRQYSLLEILGNINDI